MKDLTQHVTRTLIAGAVALLPIGGLILGFVWAERAIADSWLAEQTFYFPGLGIALVLAATYGIGLTVTTLVGKLVWESMDDLLEALPAVGTLYRTLKQVLGYGVGGDALFRRVVFVPGRDEGSEELGLVTNDIPTDGEHPARLVVFVPSAPTPTSGRVVVIEAARTRDAGMSVHHALKFLVAVGKLEPEREGQEL